MSTDNPFITERIAAAMQNLGGLPVELPNAIIDAGVHIAWERTNSASAFKLPSLNTENISKSPLLLNLGIRLFFLK